MNRLVIGLVLLAAVTIAACSGSGDEESPEATATGPAVQSDDETQYVEQVAAIDVLIVEKVGSIGEALATTWPTKERLLSVLGDADVSGTFEAMVQQAEQLEAPERYQSDHDSYLQFLRDGLLRSRDFDQAIDDSDLVAVQLAQTDLFLSRTRLLVEASPAFCQAALDSELPPSCASAEPPAGGAYGAELYAIFRLYAAEFNPRVGAFPPAFTPEERFAALEVLQPGIISTLEEALGSVRALEPPSELLADHDRLIQYLEETLDVSRAISQAAEDQDFAATEEQFERSGAVVCSAVQDLSPEVLLIVAAFFQGPAEDCGQPL